MDGFAEVIVDVARRQVAAPIVDRAAEFDEWAVVAAPALLRFAHVITRSDHDASDAVQDALLAVYGSWRRLRRDDAYEAYARRVIVNKTISRWRRIGRRERALDELGGPEVDQPDLAETSTNAILAHQLLVSLPARQRAAVSLRFYDDLPFGQIADILGCTESTARSYIHRALARLREQLADGSAREADHV